MNIEQENELKELHSQLQVAVRLESEVRESSMLPINLKLLDIPVKQFTPLHYIYLDFADNPHINNKREPNINDTMQFLWIVSVDYKANDAKAFDEFRNKYLLMDHQSMCGEINEYLSYALMDIGIGKYDDNKPEQKLTSLPTYGWIIPYVDILAKQYGWTDDYILNLPFARILQYVRYIQYRSATESGGKLELKNALSDPVVNEFRKKQLEFVNNKKA